MKNTLKRHTANVFMLLISFLFGFTIDSFSQISPQGLTPEMLLPKFNEMSPEAASLGRYGAFQVSEYSGSPNIKIPLYTIHSGDISIPIELYYDASGIKVEQDATFVGLGWNLSYGGCINHIVCGEDDFVEYPYKDANFFKSYYSNKYIPDDIPLEYYYTFTFWKLTGEDVKNPDDYLSRVEELKFHNDMAKGFHIPDVFQASFCGHNLSFIIDKRDSSKIVIVGGDTQKYKIQYEIDNKYPSMFRITDDKGITYQFKAFTEFGKEDAYYLTKVYDGSENESGKSLIEYKYRQESYLQRYGNYIQSIGKHNKGEYSEEYALQINALLGTHVHEGYRGNSPCHRKVYPSTITTGLDTIEFTYKEREDIIDTYAISGIRVKSKEGIVLDTISLSYDYYTEQPSLEGYYTNKRLRLKNVAINSQKYQLSYSGSILPSTSYSASIDYWGYYNAAKNESKRELCGTPKYLLKDDLIRPVNYLGEANRYASEDSCKVGMLKRITYPTGGYTDYEFEANRFNDKYYYPDASHKISFPASTDTIKDGTLYMHGGMKPQIMYLTAQQKKYDLHIIDVLKGYFDAIDVTVRNEASKTIIESFHDRGSNQGKETVIPLSLAEGVTYEIEVKLTAEEINKYSTVAQCWITHDSINTNIAALPTTRDENGGYSIGGGLRIKVIKNYDSDNSYINGIEYEYKDGKLLIPTVQLEKHRLDFSDKSTSIKVSFDYANSEPSYYYICSLGVPATVGYSTVIKKEITKDGEIQRKTIYDFHNCGYEMNDVLNQVTCNSFYYCNSGYANGKLKKESVYTGNNEIQHTTDYSYDKIRQYYVFFPKCVPTFPPAARLDIIHWDVGLFRHNVYWTYLTKKKETFYDANGNETTSKETTYSYDDSNYQVSQQTVSDGQNTEKVRYWYPLNSGNQSTGLSHLINKNCLSEVTGVETYRNGFFTGGSKFNYTTNNIGIPVVEECYSILPDSNRTNVLEMKVTGYDNYGNIREYEKKDGTPVTILWSYSHQYPVMEIVGKRYDDIKSDDVDKMEDPQVIPIPTENQIRSVYNTIRTKNPDAHVTAYIYTPWHTISSIITPNGYETHYGYDDFGRLKEASDFTGILQKYQYNYKIK